MPMVVAGAAVAGFASGITITGGVLAFTGFGWGTFLGSLALGGLSHALTPKPKKQSFVSPVDRNSFAIRQPVVTRKHVYGFTRMTDVYAHMTTVGDDSNAKLHAFLVISDDEWQAVDEIWVDDYVIPIDWLDADGNVTQGRYAGKLRVRIHLGSPNQVADPIAVAEIPEWTDAHRGRGVCYAFLTLTKDRDVYPTGMPNFSLVGRARKIYDPRTGDTKFASNIALFCHDYLAQADFGFQAKPETINPVNIAAEANICDEIVDTAALDMTLSAVDTGTDIISMTGARLLFQMGDRVEIVTAGSAPGGTATGTDYYVIIKQTKDTPRIKLAASLQDAIDGIAVNLTSAGSGTITIRKTGEPRYHGAGVADTAEQLGEVLTDMLNSMAGRAIHAGGIWKLLSGAWREPVLTLGVGDMRADGFDFQHPVEMAEKFNIIAGKYISSINNFQPADYPTIKYQAFIDQDGGLEYPPKQLHLNFTDRATTGQRIGKIEMFRSRQDIVLSSTFSTKALEAQPGDTLYLDIPDFMGFDEKIFEVTQTGINTGSSQNPAITIDHALRETEEAVYNWESGEGVLTNPAANTSLPNPFVVQILDGVFFSSRAVQTTSGDTLYTLGMGWNEHPNALVTERGRIEVEFKPSYYPAGHALEGERTTDMDWDPATSVDGAAIFTDVVTSSSNVQYDLRARALNRLGRRGPWATLNKAVVGSSGGVGTTEDDGNWTEGLGSTFDYGNWTDPVGATIDDGSFT